MYTVALERAWKALPRVPLTGWAQGEEHRLGFGITGPEFMPWLPHSLAEFWASCLTFGKVSFSLSGFLGLVAVVKAIS